MEYRTINPEAALAVKEYLLPGITENPNFSKFFFYAAVREDGGLAGLIAIDPVDLGAAILSVGMSPEYCNKGYGSELLRYAMRDLSKKLGETNKQAISIRASFSVERGRENRLSSFFFKNGFLMEGDCPVYRISLEQALAAPILKEATARKKPDGLHVLKDVPAQAVNVFSNKVLHEGLYPAIRRQGLDGEVSVCFMPGREILGCALFEDTDDGILQNLWIYVSSDASAANRMIFLLMLAECLRHANEKFLPTKEISILAVEDVSRELLRKVFPGVQPVYILQSHMRTIVADRGEEMPEEDMVFEEVLSA